MSLPYKYTITTSHIIGIYSYVCVLTFSIVFLPHDTMPGNRQYTPCESIANGKAGGNPFIQQKEDSRLLAHRLSPTEVVDQRSHWRALVILMHRKQARLSHREVGFKRSTRLVEKPRRCPNLGAFFMPIQKNFLTFFLRTLIIYVTRRNLWQKFQVFIR